MTIAGIAAAPPGPTLCRSRNSPRPRRTKATTISDRLAKSARQATSDQVSMSRARTKNPAVLHITVAPAISRTP